MVNLHQKEVSNTYIAISKAREGMQFVYTHTITFNGASTRANIDLGRDVDIYIKGAPIERSNSITDKQSI